jgi:hypothetical protein
MASAGVLLRWLGRLAPCCPLMQPLLLLAGPSAPKCQAVASVDGLFTYARLASPQASVCWPLLLLLPCAAAVARMTHQAPTAV